MRVLALIVVVWSFMGMPTLCRAGILVECCASGVPGHDKSHDAPDKCPNKCPCGNRDKYPDDTDDTESSEPRDCDSCAESCNVVSLHSKQTDSDDIGVMLVAVIAVTQVPCDAILSHQHRSRNRNTMQIGDHLPIPASDRPLLI